MTPERENIEERLRAVGDQADVDIDLAGTALMLAALDRPGVAIGRYQEHLARLGAEVGESAGRASRLADRVAAINAVIYGRNGYAGDTLTYDDTQNANLMRVIDRRKGLPVALGILYIHAARAQGWAAAGVAFPAHFLVRLDGVGDRAVIDPFHGGKTVAAGEMRDMVKHLLGADVELDPAYYEAVGNRAVLLRLQNNIKTRAVRAKDPGRAVQVLRSMLLIAPEHAPSWRELGYLQTELGHLRDAVRALDRYLSLPDADGARHQAAAFLQSLKARLN